MTQKLSKFVAGKQATNKPPLNRTARIRAVANLEVPIYKLVPNIITILGLCLGVTSIRYALDYKWSIAAALILIAAIMDGIDGRLARLLNSASRFGAQLDSLADVISFGVAPAVITYLWSLSEIPYKGVGWAVALFYIACSAIRLARFNSNLDDPEAKKKLQDYFTGIPMPAAAFLILCPMITTFELIEIYISPWVISLYMIIVGLLMVSRVPTFSFKTVAIKREYIPLILVAIAAVIATTILEPWKILPVVGLIYVCTLPISIFQHCRSLQKTKTVE